MLKPTGFIGFYIFNIMAKELPYFQFEPAEYLTGDISFCSLSAQGLFTIICSYYWQRSCKLTQDQFLRRINEPKAFQELINENVISIKENEIKIKFLDEQLNKVVNKSKTNSINGSKGGRPKKQKLKESETKAKQKPIESETKGIREDKIREDKIKEETTIYEKFVAEVKAGKFQIQTEALYMRLRIRENTLTPLLKEFKLHLLEEQREHKTTKDFFNNFKNWLNVQDRLQLLNKYKK